VLRGAGGASRCASLNLSYPTCDRAGVPGALSALGILVSDVVKDYSRTVLLARRGQNSACASCSRFAALKKGAAKDFQKEAWQGRVHYQRSVDLRYHGQGYELNLLSKESTEGFPARTPAPLRLRPR